MKTVKIDELRKKLLDIDIKFKFDIESINSLLTLNQVSFTEIIEIPEDLIEDPSLKNRYTIPEKAINTDREVRTETAAHEGTPLESSGSRSRQFVGSGQNVMDLNMITIEDLKLNENKLFTDEKPAKSGGRSRNKSK